jgi:acyl-CoA synthetase (AMP-forming)/AMP-acid ligase II
LGTVNVPLNPLWREAELRHVLADAGARFVITVQKWHGQNYPARLANLLPELPRLERVIVCDGEPGDDGRFIAYSAVARNGGAPRPVTVTNTDPALLSYTSGTTGKPKGVLHTRGRLRGVIRANIGPHLWRSPLRCLLLPFPPYQSAGILGVVIALLAGGKVVLMDQFDPRRALELIQRERVTQIAASPTMLRLMLSMPGDYDLSSVRRITFSTEACPADLARALRERIGCHLQNMYGTTETMLITWTTPDDPWERAATTVGKPVPGVRVRIVDDARRDLPIGQTGEIAVQTKQMMIGYYNDPELTAQVLDRAGWYYTGDIGYIGADGYLRVVDRKKDLIIRGGQNIYPAEIEAYLQTHPAIQRAAVIGVPDSIGGEAVWAFIELYPGTTISTRAVLDFCRDHIAPYKIPERVHLVERLPLNGSGKVEKHKLREMAQQEKRNGTP